MARERTSEEILDEVVYAAHRVIEHYGTGLSEDGLIWLREAISKSVGPFWCDCSWRNDIPEGEEQDFHELLPPVLSPSSHMTDFDWQVRASKGLLVPGVDYKVVKT